VKSFLKRFSLTVLLVVVGLMAPIGYIELACQPQGIPSPYTSILPPAHQRAEGRTLLTYPEWHIVHAYEEYAEVVGTGDPHDFGYLSSIGGFWTSLCSLSKVSGSQGGFPGEFKQTIYTIGVSFTVEMLAKAAYEETIGRAATWLRGDAHSTLDTLSAEQAKAYSHFLRQVPWYKWDFQRDAAALARHTDGSLRDSERRIALGLEYKAKAQYAKLISAAVATMEPDALQLRMIVKDINVLDLGGFEDVRVIGRRKEGIEIETPRYRALTGLLARMARDGVTFVEIAGNDDIMLTALSSAAGLDGAIYSFARQGFGDTRHLVMVKVDALSDTLRQYEKHGLKLEHIHDY